MASEQRLSPAGRHRGAASARPHWQAVRLSPFYPPDRGKYRFRISASGFQSAGKPVTYRVDAGRMRHGGQERTWSATSTPRADKPAVVEFVESLEPQTHAFGSSLMDWPGRNTVHKIGADKYEGPGLAVQWVEVEGPLHDTWPPAEPSPDLRRPAAEARADLQLPQRVEVVSKNPEADAERILRAFARRAFRRAVTDDDIKPFLDPGQGQAGREAHASSRPCASASWA